jgi:hypothetical protein
MTRKLPFRAGGRKLVGNFRRMELANCRYCGEPGFWGKSHAKCVAIAGEGQRELRAAIQAALKDDFSMGAIRRIVSDIAERSSIPQRDTRALIVEEYLRALDGQVNGGGYDIELQDRLEELRRQFSLSSWECLREAA